MTHPPITEHTPVNGVNVYWESRGSGGTPLVVTHGGYGLTSMFGEVLDRLAEQGQVIAVELQAHGHTRDIDRAFSFEAFGDGRSDLAPSPAQRQSRIVRLAERRHAAVPFGRPRSGAPLEDVLDPPAHLQAASRPRRGHGRDLTRTDRATTALPVT